jgi:hypothetical protein
MRSRTLLWLLIVIGCAALLLAVFLASGGIYRTVNVGGGSMYIVNRFTGETRIAWRGLVSRARTEREAARELARLKKTQQKEERRQREENLRVILDGARSAGAKWIGDEATLLYHTLRPESFGRSWMYPEQAASPTAEEKAAAEATQPSTAQQALTELELPRALADHLADVARPRYLTSQLEALGKGYWPCQRCMPSDDSAKVLRRTAALEWPQLDAPVSFWLSRGQPVTVIAKHGGFWAISSEKVTTGERHATWVVKSALETAADRYPLRCP